MQDAQLQLNFRYAKDNFATQIRQETHTLKFTYITMCFLMDSFVLCNKPVNQDLGLSGKVEAPPGAHISRQSPAASEDRSVFRSHSQDFSTSHKGLEWSETRSPAPAWFQKLIRAGSALGQAQGQIYIRPGENSLTPSPWHSMHKKSVHLLCDIRNHFKIEEASANLSNLTWGTALK